MAKPKRTLSRGDVQLEIGDYIRDNFSELGVQGRDGKQISIKGNFQVVATIQRFNCENKCVGEFDVELCFTGEWISPFLCSGRVKVSESDDDTPIISVINLYNVRPL